jgi:methionine-rich copper-binding protein CopC
MAVRALLIRRAARLGGWFVLPLAVVGAFAFQASACAQATDPHAGHGMAGMSMAGMTPPAPTPPPSGAAVTLNAASPDAPNAVRGSPGQIMVTFPAPVTLTSLTLTNAVGQQIPNRMTLPADPVRSVRIPVVIPLQPGAYKVAWRAAQQGAPMNGSGSFKVQLADGSDPAVPAMHHHH